MEQDRVEHWNEGHKIERQGPHSPSNPINRVPGHLDHIRGKKILEIGPGDGRQLNLIKPYTEEYAIADISPRCLHKYKKSIANRYLIHSFDDNFNNQFDMVVLFYVWHHVLMEETVSFMNFLNRHTKEGGKICFNISPFGQTNPSYKTTTARNPDEMKTFLTMRGYQILYEDKDVAHFNDYLFLIKKC